MQARRLRSQGKVNFIYQRISYEPAIPYSATVAGNTDVYVIPTAGGDPKRLTYHPGLDRVRGWTPDGRNVVFASVRTSAPQQAYWRLWSISVNGGLPEPLPMPRAFSVAYSPDGKKLAYEEITTAFIPAWYQLSQWRHYRGGRTQPVRLLNLADHSVEKLPWNNSNDTLPMWIGNTIRRGIGTLCTRSIDRSCLLSAIVPISLI